MAELKTTKNNRNVRAFIKGVTPEQKQKDSEALLTLFQEVTHEKPVRWGTQIIGFGEYHYKSTRSSQEGDWPLTGFSPRKQNLTLYIMPGFTNYDKLLQKLGKHKTSVSCLYINRLSDINIDVLKELIKQSVIDMKKQYHTP